MMDNSMFELWNGDYEKDPYLALINDKIVPCWPNAGEMIAVDGTGRRWKPEDGIQVCQCSVEEHILVSRRDGGRVMERIEYVVQGKKPRNKAWMNCLSSWKSEKLARASVRNRAKWHPYLEFRIVKRTITDEVIVDV